ncbi:phage integrase SAM-like domain-containing protein [Hymenobacter sp. DH14]|uniref:Phage integrase SAM-like domain-containing protein n=1 Tax=Hymenobacter cyanobacteriorum TaxID=2926463 RepID=A0A9X1VM67_9BACT|nr:phage integrase SAM-like domain-containing protein [Hymenobacter cyanobacteriorum]MCI1188711.1 phage integrase SAM-like domain-containing protein [Hymenobacter cyanobacteriorum]
MLRPTPYKRKISVRLYPRLASTNQSGFCPVRLTARWHGEELQVDTGEIILPQREGKNGEIELLWHSESQTVMSGRKLTAKEEGTVPTHPDFHYNINSRLSKMVKQVVDTFNRLWDAAPFEKVSKAAMFAELLPAEVRSVAAPAPVKMGVTRTFRQVLEEWKAENRNLAKDSLRKYDQLATMMEVWRPELRPEQVTQKVAKEYQQHLLDLQKSDATIKIHFAGIRKCLEQLNLKADMAWLQYSAKNAPQLDLEMEEVRRLISWRPTSEALAEERDRWLFQMFSGRRYEDLEKFDKRERIMLTLGDGTNVPALLHAQGKTGNDAAVPLPPIAVKIGEHWNWHFPARTWQQRGDLIKEIAKQAGLTREWDDRLITGGKVVHNWRPIHQVIGTHTARHTAGTLLKQVSGGNKALAKMVLGHADEDVTDRYAKDKARLLAPAVLEAWQKILGEWYDGVPVR